jgi:hypothetical protein
LKLHVNNTRYYILYTRHILHNLHKPIYFACLFKCTVIAMIVCSAWHKLLYLYLYSRFKSTLLSLGLLLICCLCRLCIYIPTLNKIRRMWSGDNVVSGKFCGFSGSYKRFSQLCRDYKHLNDIDVVWNYNIKLDWRQCLILMLLIKIN